MLESPIIIVLVTGGELIMLASAMGVVASELWILPAKQAAESSILVQIRSRLRRLLGLNLIGLTLFSAIELLLRTAGMSGLPVLKSFPAIDTVLLKTHFGHLWLWRSAALLVLWSTWVLNRPETLSRILSITACIALAAIAITISATGHAGDDGILSPANIANSLHIIGAILWGGGIVATAMIILPSLIHTREPVLDLIASASLRLSTLAGIGLGLVAIPGIYNAWLQVGSWHGLWSTLYGQLLVAKVTLIAGMVALGALNRYRYVPAMQRNAGRPTPHTLFTLPRLLRGVSDTTSAMHFFRSLRVEMALLLGVLLLAAALSQQMPTAHAEHDDRYGHVHGHA